MMFTRRTMTTTIAALLIVWQISLLTAQALRSAAEIRLSAVELVFAGVKAQTTIPDVSFYIYNDGVEDLKIAAISLSGTNAADFQLPNLVSLPEIIPPEDRLEVVVRFAPTSPHVGALTAAVLIANNDDDEANLSLPVYGLSANALEGTNEPPLHTVITTLGININVGGTGLIIGTSPSPIGDEVLMPLMQKATSGMVTIIPIARYSPDLEVGYGYYLPDGSATPPRVEIGVIAKHTDLPANSLYPPNYQTLYPKISVASATLFDPGGARFGLFTRGINGRVAYTEDALNTDSAQIPHAVRIYPYKNRAGVALPNTYLVAFEDAKNGDYQDYDFIIKNVMIAAPPTATPTITLTASNTATFTTTYTPSITATPSNTPTVTPTLTASRTPTASLTPTTTDTPTATATETITLAPSITAIPSDTPIVTATPSPLPQTPTATLDAGIELLVNGGFETDLDADKIPDGWTVTNQTGDKMKCLPSSVNSGLCAWVFKGGGDGVSAESAQLIQKVVLNTPTLAAGDTLILQVYTQGSGAALDATLKLTVTYTETALPPTTASITLTPNTSFALQETLVTLNGTVAKLKLKVIHHSASGKLRIDDVSLRWLAHTAGSRDTNFILPLPGG